MTAPICTPKLAAKILRALAEDLENYHPLGEPPSSELVGFDPQDRLVAVVTALQDGQDAELSSQDVTYLKRLAVPAAAIAAASV